MTCIKARFDGKVLVPEEPVSLPTGHLQTLQITDEETPPRGSPAAILEAMRSLDPMSKEDAEELERLIEEGKLPVNDERIFDEE